LQVLPDQGRILIEKLNAGIIEHYQSHPRIQILDLDALTAYAGCQNAMSPQMMSMARIPFSETFLNLLARRIISHIIATRGLTRKCLVLDCDNTLWGGIIGEDGLDGIQIGHDSPGREYLEFQKTILELYEQGIILAINSKNNYDDVMNVLQNHPYMLLREKHFAGLQINWNDKPSNMHRLAEEINIGLDSFVFVDDNPAERAMMRQMLPQIYTIELPVNPALYARTLRETNEFARAYLTEEDRQRGEIYAAQRQRKDLQTKTQTLEDFLISLEMVASMRRAKQTDIKRVAQLTQRTNQFNLTTHRYSEQDVEAMLSSKDKVLYVLNLKDKFGDNGTVGLAIVVKENKSWQIDTFLMSCRIIGRGAEDALVDRILTDAAFEQVDRIQAQYIRTPKNSQVMNFWQQMGFDNIELNENSSVWQYNLTNFKPKTFKYLKLINE
jgi:FkbH-like protein